tara:strand:- start:11062 stop:11397 length:336 start_codon:yes stop_codon:yes gene_type:complete
MPYGNKSAYLKAVNTVVKNSDEEKKKKKKKKKRLIKKKSIVDKAAKKAQSTEVGRTRRALHKAGADPSEYMSRGRAKISRRLEKERQSTFEKLKNDPLTKEVNKRIARRFK